MSPRSTLISFVAVVTMVVGLAGPAMAADADEVAGALLDEGFWLDPGVDIDAATATELVSAVRNEGERFMLVVLGDEPPGGATTFGDAVMDRMDVDGLVLVVTPESAGFSGNNTLFSAGEVESALDAALGGGGDDVQFVTTFVESLTGVSIGAPVPATTVQEPVPVDPGSSGGGGGVVLLVIVVVAVGGFLWYRSSRKKKDAAQVAASLDEAKSELRAQLAEVANDVLDLADRVRVAEHEEAADHYQAASATFAEVSDQLDTASDFRQLEEIADDLDEAAWQLDTAEALLEGRPAPPKPTREEPGRCFFDPAHPPPYEDATINTPAGSRTVKVCRADAARIRQGQQPRSRMINVGGRQLEAARAPKSHGGLGMSGLDAFQMILGGLTAANMTFGRGSARQPAPSRTTRTSRSGGNGGGGFFGGGIGPGKSPSSSSRSPRSSSRSSTRSTRRSRSSGRIRGGGKRRRR